MLLWLFTNVGKNSAIDIYNMTIHKIRCVRSQENCRSLQILCLRRYACARQHCQRHRKAQ